MTQSFVAEVHGTATSGAVVLTIPSGVQGQDVMVLTLAGSDTDINPDTGWNLVDKQRPSSNATHAVYTRVAAGTAGSASSDVGATVTCTPANTGTKSACALAIYRGVDPSNPIAVSAHNVISSPTGTTFTGGAVTTTADGCGILSIWADKNSVNPADVTIPSGYTSSSAATPPSGSGKSDAVIAFKAGSTAGVYGADTWSTDFTPGGLTLFTLALSPALTTQTLRPTSDVSAGISAVTGVTDNTNLYNNIDESTLSTADYVDFAASSTYECGLSTLTDPGTTTGYTVAYALGLGSGASTADWTIALYQGTTLIESWTDSNTTDSESKTHAIDSTDAANIVFTSGSATDLRLKFTLTSVS